VSKLHSSYRSRVERGHIHMSRYQETLSDATCESTMLATGKAAGQVFRDIVTKFLGNMNSSCYINTVKTMLDAFEDLGCNMSLKRHLLHSHLDYFPENLGSLSEEQGERFHKEVKEIERRYKGRWNVNMLADYWWMLKREVPEIVH
jgi:hypothetical protein